MAAPAQTADDSEAEVRENPQIEQSAEAAATPLRIPSYINQKANHITMNGADWSRLRSRFAAARDSATTVSVVHIGDSHLQADMATAEVRSRLQHNFGSHGRGLIIPFRMAGTNEPRDYVFNSPDAMVGSRLLKMPWPTDMAFTGVAVEPVNHSSFRLRIKAEDSFDTLTFHTTAPGLKVTKATSETGRELSIEQTEHDRRLRVRLPEAATEVHLTLSAPRGLAIGGVNLQRGHTGVAYHVIGNNGATYSTYSLIGGVGAGVGHLAPELIILSLGTNEAFGKITTAAFLASIDQLVGELRRHNPQAEILLVTPAECHRRIRRRTGKGKRRRVTTSFSVNTNIARLRQAVADYGRQHHLAVYDWYAVAGGVGSASRWVADHTLGRDRIHLSAAGYRLQGTLMADALLKALSQPSNSSSHK